MRQSRMGSNRISSCFIKLILGVVAELGTDDTQNRTAAVLSGWRGNGEPPCQPLTATAGEIRAIGVNRP